MFDFKYIGNNSTLGENIISKMWLISSEWHKNTHRQNALSENDGEGITPHKKTQTVPLIFDETHKFLSFKYHERYSMFEKDLYYLINSILNPYYNTTGVLLRAMFVKLLGNSHIDPHVDLGQNMVVTHRVHIPIQTNPHCFMTVGETSKNLNQFEIWEINNTEKKHSVINDSNEERIHLIVDFLPTLLLEKYKKYEYL